MNEFDSIKKEINSLLKEIETIKEKEIIFGSEITYVKEEVDINLPAINTKMAFIVKNLNEHKANFKKLDERRINLAFEKELIKQKIAQCDNVDDKEAFLNEILEIEKSNKLVLNQIAEVLKGMIECKSLLRAFKNRKSEIYAKYQRVTQAERLKKSAHYFGVSESEIFKAEANHCKKLVIEGALEEIKDEFLKSEGVLTTEQFEVICRAGVTCILSNLEKDTQDKKDAKKALQKAGWQFNLTGSPHVTGYDNLYLKLKVLAYRKYILHKKTMNLTLNDKPLFILTDFVLAEIKNLTTGAGFDLEKQTTNEPGPIISEALANRLKNVYGDQIMVQNVTFSEFKKKVIITAMNDIAINHGPWSEASRREAGKENGRDLPLNLWIPMLTHILNQLTQAPALDLAKSKKACANMWDFENLVCPKVEGFPDDLYPALQQLVYETYKKQIKPLVALASSNNLQKDTKALPLKDDNAKAKLSVNTNVFILNHYKRPLQTSPSSTNRAKQSVTSALGNFAKRVRCI